VPSEAHQAASELNTPERDAKALELRSKGRSFAGVAKTLGYDKARDANLAFNRALRRLPPDELDVARQSETARLDALTTRIEALDTLTPDDRTRQLRIVEVLRKRLLAD